MRKLETILAAIAVSAIGCESPKPARRPTRETQETYREQITISRVDSNRYLHHPQKRVTIIMNSEHPYGAEIDENGNIREPLIAPISTKTLPVQKPSTPDGVPKDWQWEQQGRWYRSPDRKYLWIDGKVRQSIEAQTKKPDHELVPWGSQEYAPKK